MYKRILVAIDNSEDAQDALEKALQFSLENESEVIVFHSIIRHLTAFMPTISLLSPTNGETSYLIHRDEINKGKKILKEAERFFAENGKKIKTRLIFDTSPDDYITKVTKEENFDLVILGCKGRHSKVKRAILGTIPDEVINNTPSDVLIVR